MKALCKLEEGHLPLGHWSSYVSVFAPPTIRGCQKLSQTAGVSAHSGHTAGSLFNDSCRPKYTWAMGLCRRGRALFFTWKGGALRLPPAEEAGSQVDPCRVPSLCRALKRRQRGRLLWDKQAVQTPKGVQRGCSQMRTRSSDKVQGRVDPNTKLKALSLTLSQCGVDWAGGEGRSSQNQR